MKDPIVEAVRQKLLDRSQAGILKYGTMLTRNDLSPVNWLRHAQEEALDLANYLEVLIQRACPEHVRMTPHYCANRAQCFEPCGELGKSDAHANPSPNHTTPQEK